MPFVNKEVKVLFQLLVDSLCLTITLWVVCSCRGKLDSEEPIELLGELSNELRSSVRDNLFGKAMMFPDVGEVESGGP